MRAAQKRVFRVERDRFRQNGAMNGQAHPTDGAKHGEVMAALSEIKARLEPQEQLSAQIIEDYKTDLLEAKKLKEELHRIYLAIKKTKQEIATIHVTGLQGTSMGRVTDELSAIVEGTESATETILSSAEDIDQKAGNLADLLKDPSSRDMASDIQDQVIRVFEACNFQDLTGQRISKVVTAFQFIEERVNTMMEIWGGLDSFADIEVDVPEAEGDAALLHGPALADDEGLASRSDIDALFD